MSDLTKLQKELADLLISTKTQAKVRRRKQNSEGSFEFYHIVRDTSPFDFRVDPEEFVFKHHEATPEAPLSPMYLNLRNLPEVIVNKIAEVMNEVSLEEIPDVCTGIPNAAVPYAKKFSEISQIPYVTIFDKDDSPAHHQILPHKEAPSGNGKKMLLVDDLITKGGSKFEAIDVAEKLGYKVTGLLVLIDRGEGGTQLIEEKGYKVYAAFTLQQLLDYYLESEKITKEQFDEVQEYLKKSRAQ
jgi:uridine monophosphate synthetase